MLKVIAASRAFVSAAEFDLWLLKNSSKIEPSGNRDTVAVYRKPATSNSKFSLALRFERRRRSLIAPPLVICND
jgi:hypothetical protein